MKSNNKAPRQTTEHPAAAKTTLTPKPLIPHSTARLQNNQQTNRQKQREEPEKRHKYRTAYALRIPYDVVIPPHFGN